MHPALQLDPLQLAARGDAVVSDALAWAQQGLQAGPILIYASAPPDEVKSAQATLGRDRAGSLVERAMAALGRITGVSANIVDYHEHALDEGTAAQAVSYVWLGDGDDRSWGVGIADDSMRAAIMALLSAVNAGAMRAAA
jgi:hypothetical protein